MQSGRAREDDERADVRGTRTRSGGVETVVESVCVCVCVRETDASATRGVV